MKFIRRSPLEFVVIALLGGLASFALAHGAARDTRAECDADAEAMDARTEQGVARGPKTIDESLPTLESARQRWERLTPEQKTRARERYEQYLALSDSERSELAERAQRLKENSTRVQREFSPGVRERLSTLEPEKRQELIGEIVEGEAKAKGQRIRNMLPDNVLKRLESARPEDRARYLEDFKLKQRKRVARFAIDQIGRALSLPSTEVDRLKALPDDERARAVLELKKKLSEREAAEFGLPPGISQSEWESWEKLPAEEFYERMQRYEHTRASLGSDGAAPDARSSREERAREAGERARNAGESARENGDAGREAGVRTAPADELRAGQPNQAGADEKRDARADQAPPRAPAPQRFAHAKAAELQKLAEARRPRPDDLLDLADLSKAERAARVEHLRRERCLAVIREGELLPPERIAELSAAPNPAVFEAVRRLLAATHFVPRRNGPVEAAPHGEATR